VSPLHNTPLGLNTHTICFASHILGIHLLTGWSEKVIDKKDNIQIKIGEVK
jgi:hypothetical protein